MFAHAIKVLSPKEQAGLWYLINLYKEETSRICAQHAITLGHVRGIIKGLLHLRNKTLFHLDARGVRDPKKVWETADISWRRFDDALEAGFRLLCHLHTTIVGTDYELPPYDGADATRILTLADHADLFSHPLREDATITHISRHGFWLLAREGEHCLAFSDFPWFRNAPVGHVLNVEEPTPGHYYWPDLDVDLSLQIIRHPERFPLKARVS
jgi:hypothetical protein